MNFKEMAAQTFDELSNIIIESESGSGFVKIKSNGLGEIKEILVEDNELVKQDIPMLLSLIKISLNISNVKRTEKEKEVFDRFVLKYKDDLFKQ